LQQVVVTGYLIPRIGEGPQPVTSYDQTYIQNTGYQNVTDVLQNLPGATGNFNPGVLVTVMDTIPAVPRPWRRVRLVSTSSTMFLC
jgi:hypothetical protein